MMLHFIEIEGEKNGKKLDDVEVLRHSRHDWLNKIQLIKGNLRIKSN